MFVPLFVPARRVLMRLDMHRRVLSIVFVGSLFTSSLARADDVDAKGPPAAPAVVGGFTTATGALLVGLGATSTRPEDLEIAGAITVGFGLAASLAGVVLAVVNAKTAVTQKASDAPERTPTWHDASVGPAEVARPTLLPLFIRSF